MNVLSITEIRTARLTGSERLTVAALRYARHCEALAAVKRAMADDRCTVMHDGTNSTDDISTPPCWKLKEPREGDTYGDDGVHLRSDACAACVRNEVRLKERYALGRRSGGIKRAFLLAAARYGKP